MKNYRLKVYCDFDGTIAKNDVWINSLGKFIKDKKKFDEICEDFYSLKIGTRECNLRQLELINNFSLDKFNSYLDEEEIDEHFADFVYYCRQNDISITILSSGLDYYIDYILKRENLNINFFSSKMVLSEEQGKITCEYIHTDEYCSDCETCKRNILINNTNDITNEISIYIGDGVSDYCVSRFADYVFAKDLLASYCWKNNITYFDYKNFSDIKNKLIKMKEANKFRHRQEAGIRRRDVFMGG